MASRASIDDKCLEDVAAAAAAAPSSAPPPSPSPPLVPRNNALQCGAGISALCDASVQLLQTGARRGAFDKAAAQLSLTADAVERYVAAISHLLISAARHRSPSSSVAAALAGAGTPEEQAAMIASKYAEHQHTLLKVVESTAASVPTLKDLHWRLDVSLGSRLAHDDIAPTIVVRVDTTKPSQSAYLQIDLAHLRVRPNARPHPLPMTRDAFCRRCARNWRRLLRRTMVSTASV
jgi:hypothetical protein